MIALTRPTGNEVLGDVLMAARPLIEGMAAKRGHPSPEDFFGEFVVQICEKPRAAHMKIPHLVWLAKWRLYDYYRKRPAVSILPLDQTDQTSEPVAKHGAQANPRFSSGGARNGSAVRRALASLRPMVRDAVIRKYILCQSNQEIAAATGKSMSATRSTLDRARRRLRKDIGASLSTQCIAPPRNAASTVPGGDARNFGGWDVGCPTGSLCSTINATTCRQPPNSGVIPRPPAPG